MENRKIYPNELKWSFSFPAVVTPVWDYTTNTQRMQQSSGLFDIVYTGSSEEEKGISGFFKWKFYKLAFVEKTIVFMKQFYITREFKFAKGPLTLLKMQTHYTESQGQTTIHIHLSTYSPSFISSFLLFLYLRLIFKRKYNSALKHLYRFLLNKEHAA